MEIPHIANMIISSKVFSPCHKYEKFQVTMRFESDKGCHFCQRKRSKLAQQRLIKTEGSHWDWQGMSWGWKAKTAFMSAISYNISTTTCMQSHNRKELWKECSTVKIHTQWKKHFTACCTRSNTSSLQDVTNKTPESWILKDAAFNSSHQTKNKPNRPNL